MNWVLTVYAIKLYFSPSSPSSDLVDIVPCAKHLGEGADGNDLLDSRRKVGVRDRRESQNRQERKKKQIFPKQKLPRGLSD